MSLITNAPVTSWLALWQYSFHFLLAKHFQPSLTIAYLQSLLPIIQIDIPWHWPWEYKSAHGWLTYFGFLEPSRSSSASWPPATCCLLQQMNRPFTLFWPLNTCDFSCCLNVHSSSCCSADFLIASQQHASLCSSHCCSSQLQLQYFIPICPPVDPTMSLRFNFEFNFEVLMTA